MGFGLLAGVGVYHWPVNDIQLHRFFTPACKALYERLRAKGKTGKQGLIAVCDKLLKQVFAVMEPQTLYQPNYCSPKP
jgi:hypothetical protein